MAISVHSHPEKRHDVVKNASLNMITVHLAGNRLLKVTVIQFVKKSPDFTEHKDLTGSYLEQND